ncbi:MAG: hypothetical protein ORN83_10865 [Chthoniobacteraceae bacterium]|nr:hypothetical protein [Chthoniobacteraceae bacterium]
MSAHDSDKFKDAKIHLFIDADSSQDRLSPGHLRLWVCTVSTDIVVKDASGDEDAFTLHYGVAFGYGGGGVQETLSFVFSAKSNVGMVSHAPFADVFEQWFDEEESGDLDEGGSPEGYEPEDWRDCFGGELADISVFDFNQPVGKLIRSKLEEWLEEEDVSGGLVLKTEAIPELTKVNGPVSQYAENEEALLEVIDFVAGSGLWPFHLRYQNGEFDNLA